MNRLYVGNLSYSTTDDGLRAFFAEAGDVKSAEVVIDRATGRSKGFAFVTMADAAGAQAAIDRLNGQLLDNRPIRIDLARPKEDRPRASAGGSGGGDRPRGSFSGGGDRQGGGSRGGGFGGGDRGGYGGGNRRGGSSGGRDRDRDRGRDRDRNRQEYADEY
jgi:RNA recognition motif-containing protein